MVTETSALVIPTVGVPKHSHPPLSLRYDSFTGVPVCQQNVSLEKASILFNMAALYSQIGTRSDRQNPAGLEEAIASFQIAAGRKIVC